MSTGKGAGQALTSEIVYVYVCLQSLAMLHEYVKKLCAFLLQTTPTATPPFACWPEQFISCPLAHDQPFH